MAIKKAETTRVSVVLENDTLAIIDQCATETKITRSEVIRFMIEMYIGGLKKGVNKMTDKT